MADPLSRRLDALLAEADRLEREADEAADRGDQAAALVLSRRALGRRYLVEELRGGVIHALNVKPSRGNVQAVTKAQVVRRGTAIAKSRAASSKDPRRVAMARRWGSQAQAAKAAGVTPASLVGYLDGDRPCPRRVAEKLAVDPALPATAATWPRGITD